MASDHTEQNGMSRREFASRIGAAASVGELAVIGLLGRSPSRISLFGGNGGGCGVVLYGSRRGNLNRSSGDQERYALSIRRAPRSGARGRSRTARRTGSPIGWFVSRSDPAVPAGLRCRPARRMFHARLLIS